MLKFPLTKLVCLPYTLVSEAIMHLCINSVDLSDDMLNQNDSFI